MFIRAGEPSLLHCLWVRGQRGNSASLLLISSTLSNRLSCQTGSFCGFSELASTVRLTGLVVLVDFFFNSLVVRVPCGLIFWRFWLFIDFRLVVILLVV